MYAVLKSRSDLAVCQQLLAAVLLTHPPKPICLQCLYQQHCFCFPSALPATCNPAELRVTNSMSQTMNNMSQFHGQLVTFSAAPQVYASYRFRRDLAEAAKPWPNTLATHSKPLTQQDLDKRCYRDPVASSVHSQGPAKQQPPAHGSSSSSDSSSRSSSNSSSNHSSSRSSSSNANHSQTAAAAGGVSGYSTSSHSSSTSSSSSSKGRQRSLGVGEIALDSADMRQAIAWQLCHRQILHQQIAAAADYLKQTMSADDVRDIRVSSGVLELQGHFLQYVVCLACGSVFTHKIRKVGVLSKTHACIKHCCAHLDTNGRGKTYQWIPLDSKSGLVETCYY